MKERTDFEKLPSSLSVADMASYLGISKAHAYNILNQTNIPKLRLGERIVIPKDLFFEWIRVNSTSDE